MSEQDKTSDKPSNQAPATALKSNSIATEKGDGLSEEASSSAEAAESPAREAQADQDASLTPEDTVPPEATPPPIVPPPRTTPAAAASSPPPKRRKFLWFAWFILLVLATAAAGAAYYAWSQQQKTQAHILEMSQQLEIYARSMATQRETLEELDQALEQRIAEKQQSWQQQTNSRVQQQQKQMELLQQRVDAQQQRLAGLTTTSREDWLLAEAEYLLKLANQRILLERNPSNAIALLNTADGIIQKVAAGLGDAELFAVRKALAKDLAALMLVEPLDKEGVHLKLQALAEQLDSLPRSPSDHFWEEGVARQEQEPTDSEDESVPTGFWHRLWFELTDMVSVLDNYIRFDDVTAPVQPLVDSHLAQLAGLNVRMAIEQAQVALLKEESAVYQRSLATAQQLIGQYYLASPAAGQFQASLAQMASLDVAPELPDISNSLKLLHDYIDQLHKTTPQSEGQL